MSAEVRSYRISPRARQDLEAIWRYTFKTWSLDQADNYYNGLVGCFSELVNGTKRGRLLTGSQTSYLAFAFSSHFIIYRQSGASLTIVRVLHRRMNIAAHL